MGLGGIFKGIGKALGGAAAGALGGAGGGLLGRAVGGAIGSMKGSKPTVTLPNRSIIMDDPERGGITGRSGMAGRMFKRRSMSGRSITSSR